MATWTGLSSTDWFTSGNWLGFSGPTPGDPVSILGAPAPRYPNLTNDAMIASLLINTGDTSKGLTLSAFSDLVVNGNLTLTSGLLGIGILSTVAVAGTADLTAGVTRFDVANNATYGKITQAGILKLGGQINISVGSTLADGTTLTLAHATSIVAPADYDSGFHESVTGLGTQGYFVGVSGTDFVLKTLVNHEFDASAAASNDFLEFYYDSRSNGPAYVAGGGTEGSFYQHAYNVSSVKGTSGFDVIKPRDFGGSGTARNMHIAGLGGDDDLGGGFGNDSIEGGSGNDTLSGGKGIDTVLGGDNDDTVLVENAQTSTDTYDGGNGYDYLVVDSVNIAFLVDFSSATVTSFDELVLGDPDIAAATNIVVFRASQFTQFTKVTGLDSNGVSEVISIEIGDHAVPFSLAGLTLAGFNNTADIIDILGDDDGETITGSSARDRIHGNGGHDNLTGGAGADTLLGDEGNDTLRGETGTDLLDGGDGSDLADYSYETQSLIVTMAESGPYTLTAGSSDTLTDIEGIAGGSNDDSFNGNSAANFFFGNAGDDTFKGSGGNDTIDGGTTAGDADEARFTGDYSQYLVTKSGDTYTVTDTVANRDGTDTVANVEYFNFNGVVGQASQVATGSFAAFSDANAGDPVAESGSHSGDATAAGNVLTNDVDPNSAFGIKSVSGVRAGPSDGSVMGPPGTATGVYGSLLLNADGSYVYTLNDADTDTQKLKTGQVVTDLFSYASHGAGLGASFAELTITITGSNEIGHTVKGTRKADQIDLKHKIKNVGATNDDDTLNGNKGNDTIKGAAGDDKLAGGAGRDKLTGNAGMDQFVFAAHGTKHADVVTDFKHGIDKIVLDRHVFAGVGTALDEGEFLAAKKLPKAKQADDHILYNKTTGQIFYDDDGKGKHAAVLIVTFDHKPSSFDYTDFMIA